jgi:hypothetical protein
MTWALTKIASVFPQTQGCWSRPESSQGAVLQRSDDIMDPSLRLQDQRCVRVVMIEDLAEAGS